MAFGPLVSCEELAQHLDDPTWLVLDCRYELADKEKGVRDYAKGHIPGSYHAHVDRDLSGPVGDGHRGRHPLPLPGAFQRFCGDRGIVPGTKVVVLDDAAGQWASRAWWLLRYYGHTDVAVLDGGMTRWKQLKLPLRDLREKPRKPVPFTNQPGAMPTTDAGAIAAGGITILDARAPERFRGEVEPVDKKAGHIPGARSAPLAGNVGADMRFLAADKLRERFTALGATVGTGPAGAVACYCGSGVTATHNVLAMVLAGLPTPSLYPGSWSEWSWPEANRPVATGP